MAEPVSPLAALYGRMTAGPWEISTLSPRLVIGEIQGDTVRNVTNCFGAVSARDHRAEANAAGIVAAHRLLAAVAEPAELEKAIARELCEGNPDSLRVDGEPVWHTYCKDARVVVTLLQSLALGEGTVG